MSGALDRYRDALVGGRRPVATAAKVLAEAMTPSLPARARRVAAAEIVAAAAVVLPCALSRHAGRRGGGPRAAWDVVEKYGRPADLDEPAIGVRSQLSRARLDPRLGGLLGASVDAVANRLASRAKPSGAAARPDLSSDVRRGVAAVAPLILGAVGRASRDVAGLGALLATFPATALDDAGAIDAAGTPMGRLFDAVVRRAAGARGRGLVAFLFRS